MNQKSKLLLAGFLMASLAPALSRAADYQADAMAAWKARKTSEALEIISAGIKAEPKNSRLWHSRAQMRALTGQRKEAISDLTEAILVDPNVAFLWQERAQLRFKAGLFQESVSDFDRAILLRPEAAPHNWQRGIALYYAGRYDDGRRQFEQHQSVNPDDVENAVWHFLCTSREFGIEEARKRLMPIDGDSRVPMKEIHALYAGKGTPADVIRVAESGSPEAKALRRQKFYAQLYLGLYYEATGEADKARDAIRQAIDLADPDDYMGDVAKVHPQRP